MEILAITILVIFSLVGFAAIFFTTFGTLIIFIGAILYALLTEFSELSFTKLLILLGLYLCGEVMEYVFVIFGAKKFGASNKAAMGAFHGRVEHWLRQKLGCVLIIAWVLMSSLLDVDYVPAGGHVALNNSPDRTWLDLKCHIFP